MEAFGKRMVKENGLPATRLGHHRPPRGDPRRRLRRRDDPGRRRRGLRPRLRDPAEVRRRPVHRRLARARAASSAACGPSRCSSTSPATWRSSPSPGADHAPVRQPDGRQLPGARQGQPPSPSSASATACRPRSTSSPATAACPRSEITYTCGGINHMDWFLTLEHKGRDLYPRLREVFEKPEYYKNEKVRGEVFRHFGYFMTEIAPATSANTCPGSARTRRPWTSTATSRASAARAAPTTSTCKALADKYAEHDPLEFESAKIEAPQRRVLLVHHGGGRHGQALPLHGQRPQRRLHHQPARRLLRRGADLRRRHRPAPDAHRRRCRRSAPPPA